MPATCSPADAKIGRRIDCLVADHLLPALTPHGFARKARTARRAIGVGDAQVVQLARLQDGTWYEAAGARCA